MQKKNLENFERRDERNLARVGIISIQSRMEQSNQIRFVSEFEVDGQPYKVECIAPEGRPHGIDTDVVVAVETLYVRQGCPEDGWVHTTAFELRKLTGLPDNGENYNRIRNSLNRLWVTGFKVSQGIQEPTGRSWNVSTLRFIDELRYRENDNPVENIQVLDRKHNLHIKLGLHIAESIRQGYTSVLDGRILLQLEQPPARALYRMLEAHRITPGGKRESFTVKIMDWKEACGVVSDRPESIRRNLSPAHEELVAVNYLQEVKFEGRGSKQTITYVFAADNAPDPALVEMLIGMGFSRARATDTAQQYGDRVEEAVAFVRNRIKNGYRVSNPAAMVFDYLRNEGKYVIPVQVVVETSSQEAQKAVRETTRKEEEKTLQQVQSQLENVEQKTPHDQYQELKASLSILLSAYLTRPELDRLKKKCESGDLSALDVQRSAIAARANKSMDQFVDRLKGSLQV